MARKNHPKHTTQTRKARRTTRPHIRFTLASVS